MRRTSVMVVAAVLAGGTTSSTRAADGPAPRLEPIVRSELLFNGINASNDGRLFVPFQRQENGKGIPAGEIVGRKATIVNRDPRPAWVDAMWIDDQGNLPLPAARLDRAAAFNGGKATVRFPTVVCKLASGAKPLRR